jgi:phospholipid/cholesterol/gamma-HCH transport system substrate-binding protein
MDLWESIIFSTGKLSPGMAELEIKPSLWAQARVLAVILVGAAIVATLIVLLTGGGRELFSPQTTLTTLMPDATGLDQNSEVRLSGIPIGKVTGVDLSGSVDPQRVVRVQMRVKTAYLKSIPADSVASIGADTLVGTKFVSIDEGKSPVPIAQSGELRSEPLKQAIDRADLIRSLQDELRQVDTLLAEISSGETPIGQFVTRDEEYKQLLARVSAFDDAVRAFVGPDSAVGQALFSDALYNKIRSQVTSVDNTLGAIQKGEGMAGRAFTSDEQYNVALRQLRDLRATLAGVKLSDDREYRELRKMIDATDSMIASMTKGDGRMAELLRNPQLYESLNGSLRNLEELLKDLQDHPRKYLRYKVF